MCQVRCGNIYRESCPMTNKQHLIGKWASASRAQVGHHWTWASGRALGYRCDLRHPRKWGWQALEVPRQAGLVLQELVQQSPSFHTWSGYRCIEAEHRLLAFCELLIAMRWAKRSNFLKNNLPLPSIFPSYSLTSSGVISRRSVMVFISNFSCFSYSDYLL